MKTARKIGAFLLAMTMMVVSTNITAFAATEDKEYDAVATVCDDDLPENDNDLSEYFHFANPNSRMDSYGNFTFSFSWAMESDYFKPASSSLKLSAKATSSTSNQTYYIALYKVGSDNPIKNVKFTADGTAQSYQFTGLSTSSYYYLSFSKPILSNATITGTGKVSIIQ